MCSSDLMRFPPLASRKGGAQPTKLAGRADCGSAVTGFAMTAPLAVLVFLALIQVVALAMLRTTVHSAAATGARLAATLGSGPAAGDAAVARVLSDHAVEPGRATRQWRRSVVSGVPYLSLTVSVPTRIAWVGAGITVSSSVRVTDENAL